jgi:hypothetical protein
VIRVTQEDGGVAVASEGGGVCWPGWQTQVKEVKSELDRVRGKEVGMVPNQMEADWYAQERRRARVQDPSKEDGAEVSRAASHWPARWWPYNR